MTRFSLMTILALGTMLLATASGALAGDMTCTGVVSSGPTHTILGNVNVPDNANCDLAGGGMITGNVQVGKNASLIITNVWMIGGNLQANNCTFVSINPTALYSVTIMGNLQVQNCTGVGNLGKAGFDMPAMVNLPMALNNLGNKTVVAGNVQCQNNTGACEIVGGISADNMVGGNLECHDNTAPCIVENYLIKGNLQLQHNVSGGQSVVTNDVIGGNLQVDQNGQSTQVCNNAVQGKLVPCSSI